MHGPAECHKGKNWGVSRVINRQQSGSAPPSAPAALRLSHFLSHKT